MKHPHTKLATFYFFYFAILGGLAPYWSLYLESLQYTPFAIGILMATLHGTKIIAPNVWGWLADRKGGRITMVRFGALLTLLIFLCVFLQPGFWLLLILMIGFSFFWNAILPQFEVITLSHLTEKFHHYGRIRLWGSIGFIGAVMLVGVLLDWQGVKILPWVLVVIMLLNWLVSLGVSDTNSFETSQQIKTHFLDILKRPEVSVFFFVCFLMQLSHGPYYTFYSILMEGHGVAKSLIGVLWAIGVIAEVIIFWFMPRLLSKYTIKTILIVSLFIAAIRWWLIGTFSDHLILMAFTQLLHAATYGSFHAAAITFVHQTFDQYHQGKAQGLYSSMSFGLGGALGALYSGYAWENLGPDVSYWVGSGICVIAIIIIWYWMKIRRAISNL